MQPSLLRITAWRCLVRLVNSCLPDVQLPGLMPQNQTEKSEQGRRVIIFQSPRRYISEDLGQAAILSAG